MEQQLAVQPAGQLVVASDIRNTLFRRALTLLDEVHAGLEDFNFGGSESADHDESFVGSPGNAVAVAAANQQGAVHGGGALVAHNGGDPLERVLATFVQGRTNTARRAVGAVAQIHSEIDGILSSFERDFTPVPAGDGDRGRAQDVSFHAVTGQPSEEVLRMAAATTSAAARFRVRAAEAAKSALQVYDNAAKQAATAAQTTTQALEMQILAEQHSASGNLPQALDAIRQANRLRDESSEAARMSRQLQQEYMRHRREAQEAHLQADAAMRHAYSMEREALKTSSQAAERQHAMWTDRHERLGRQAEGLRAQATSLDADADAAVARAEQAQRQADEEMAAGNYDLSNALMQEAVRSQEQAGYSRAQATAARDALQRLMPDLQTARERMEESGRDVEDLSQRQAHLQDATTQQRIGRLQEETDELEALCAAAEGAAAMHEDLVIVYQERLEEDRQQYDKLSSEGKIAEADALAVHITTWEDLLDVARKNHDTSRAEAKAMRSRLADLSNADVSKDPAAALEEGTEDFQHLRGAKDKEDLATQAVAILTRGLASAALQDATVEGTGAAGDGLVMQTEMHRQRIARLAQHMEKERQRLGDGSALSHENGQSVSAQAEALLDSMAVSHLVGTLETTRLLQLWKQRSEQASASAEEVRNTWATLEQDASDKADEAVRLEEQALALEQAGRAEEASSTMAQAEHLHRMAERLRLEADKAKAVLIARETAAENAQAQTRALVQGLYDVEHAAERLQSDLGLHTFNSGDQAEPGVPSGQAAPSLVRDGSQQHPLAFSPLQASTPTNDEMATGMMSSPGAMSWSSGAAAAGNTYLTSSGGMAGPQLQAYGGHGGAKRHEDLATTTPAGSAGATIPRGEVPSSRQFGQLAPASEDPWLALRSSDPQIPETISNKDEIRLHDARLARIIQELQSHASTDAPSIPIYRWEGHAALISALQAPGSNEDAVLALSSNFAELQEQLRDGAGVAEARHQREEQRKSRWQELFAAMPSGVDASVAQVADRASLRCAAAAAASKIAEDALELQVKCQEELLSGIGSYRRAVADQRAAVEGAKSAQAEAASLQCQAQDAQALDADLSQQVQAVQEQLAGFEAEGSTAQAFTTRYELQRLQNKHADAAARASQITGVYKAAQHRADQARKKEVDAVATVQFLSRTVMTLADAAKEAGMGAQHAVDGYNHAVSALTLGAQVDLSRLGAGDDDGALSWNADADVQMHLERQADFMSHAQQCLDATRRLQQIADAGSDPPLSSVASVTSRASNVTSLNAFQTAEPRGASTEKSFSSSGSIRMGTHGEEPALEHYDVLGNPVDVRAEQHALLGNPPSLGNPLPRPTGALISVARFAGATQASDPNGRGTTALRPGSGAEASGGNGVGSLSGQSAFNSNSSGAGGMRAVFGTTPASDALVGARHSGPGVPGQHASSSGFASTLPNSSPSFMSVGQSASTAPIGPNDEATGFAAPSPAESGPGALLSALEGLKLHNRSMFPLTDSQPSKGPGTQEQGPFSSVQALLSGKPPSASWLSSAAQGIATYDEAVSDGSGSAMDGARMTLLTGHRRSASGRNAPLGGPGMPADPDAARLSTQEAGSTEQPSGSASNTSVRPIVALPFRASKAAKYEESGGLSGSPFHLDEPLADGAAPHIAFGTRASLSTAEVTPSTFSTLQVFLGSKAAAAPGASSGSLSGQAGAEAGRSAEQDPASSSRGPDLWGRAAAVFAPGRNEPLSGHTGAEAGRSAEQDLASSSRGPDLWGRAAAVFAPGRNEQSSTAVETGSFRGPGAAFAVGLGSSAGPFAPAATAIEAGLGSFGGRHHQRHSELSAPNTAGVGGAKATDFLASKRELEAQLRNAEMELRAARVQQESLHDGASPADVQASHDKMQFQEHRVAMLHQALEACGELSNSAASMERTRGELEFMDQEAQQCEDTLAELAKAAERCSSSAREVQLQALDAGDQAAPGLQQSLADLQTKREEIMQRQQQAQSEAHRLQDRRHQLKEQLAAQQAAAKLREECMQQAHKAATAASDTIGWDARLTAAREELQRLEAPIQELQDKAKAASDAAQTMTTAAMQHRAQAAGLAQQAAHQREDARRFASSGQRLEADSAQAMADSLQQQADGLLAQATRMEDDAVKLKSEAQEHGDAAGRARKRIAAQVEVVQQVSKAHQLSAAALQWNRTAAVKLREAVQKQEVAAEQQRALAKVEQDLAVMEAQMSGSGGGAVRPDELASHMINVVRAKQEASRLRAALQSAQQQQEQDRDAANAASRQATKAEGERTNLAPKIEELELQAQASLRSASLADMRPSPGEEQPGDSRLRAMSSVVGINSTHGAWRPASQAALSDPFTSALNGSRMAVPAEDPQSRMASIAQIAGDASAPRPSVVLSPLQMRGSRPELDDTHAGLSQPSVSDRVQLPTMPHADAPAGAAQAPVLQQRRVGFPLERAETTDDCPPSPSREARSEQFSQRLHSASWSPARKGRTDASQPAADGAGGGSGNQRFLLGGAAAAAGGAVGTPPARRSSLANHHQPPISSVSSPTGSVAGAHGPKFDWSPRGNQSMRSSQPSPRMARPGDDGEDARSERSFSHPSSPSPLGRARSMRAPIPKVQREDSGNSYNFVRMAAFRNPDHVDDQTAGTAGALLDQVADKSLKPLSHVNITNAAGKPVSQPYQNRDSATSFESDGRTTSTSGSGSRPSGGSTDGQSDGSFKNAMHGGFEEDEQEEDVGAEPDSKMYRTMKQRVQDVETRVLQLRRQGDTARTAADILSQKQEQRQADMSAAVDSDEEQQGAVLEHGEAMIRMKEAEASLCYKQADLLEDEAAACREALQYSVVDWHCRREVKRLEERCAALTARAQGRAVEAQGFEADVADASECIMLATSRAGRGNRAFTATLEQQQMARFIEEQQERLSVARQHAAESRSEAAQIASVAKGGAARKLLAEKKALCNKALYQSAVELADSYDHAVKIVAKMQQVKLHGTKAAADAIAERIQQNENDGAAPADQRGKSRLRNSKPAAAHGGHQHMEILNAIAALSGEVEDAMQQCLQELTGDTSDVLKVHRRRMEQISALVRLYQTSYDCSDHMADDTAAPSTAGDFPKRQLPSEASKRAVQIAAAQDAVRDLDRACEIASELRTLCLDASGVHAGLFELRAEPSAIRCRLSGQKAAAHELDGEELHAQKQRMALLNIEIPLSRDQLNATLQVLEYRQAAAQLSEAQRELQYASAVASDAVTGLEATAAVHRENIAIIHRHMNAVLHEARVFTANGNLLQAAAAEEAAHKLAKESLAAETSLAALVQEARLKRDEQLLAGAAADELQDVAEGSLELVGLLLRILSLQQEARGASRRIGELDGEQARQEHESGLLKALAESSNKQAEQLAHESLQCRTNLKFSAADAYLAESKQYRASVQDHLHAAAAADRAATAAAREHKHLCQRRKQLLREMHLLHTAAGHLQGALSCMRDKHHLVRKLRDAEYQRRRGQQSVEPDRSSANSVAEVDVLQTQVEASTATVKHHLASKASYVMAANHLHLSWDSLDREASCASRAEAAMQDIMKARSAVAATGANPSVPLLTSGHTSEAGGVLMLHSANSELALVQRSRQEDKGLPVSSTGADLHSANWQLQQAELRYRCLRGSLTVLEAVSAAAERAGEARCLQADLSDQAAVLVSDLAAKILEAEACANEAASLEGAVRANAALLDEDDEENFKAKLMLNALLQRAESYRNEALLLQGRIKELEEQERAAGAKAADLEASLGRFQADHRHALEALDLTERMSQSRDQEAALRAQAQALSAEVEQLGREAKSMESKTAQLRQQLTNASHTACSEDVANLMLVMQHIDTKLAMHRQLLQQRKMELESNEADYERLIVDLAFVTQRTEHVLHASETQEQVRQAAARLAGLQSDLSAAQSALSECAGMLDELRQQYEQLAPVGAEDHPLSEVDTQASLAAVRQSQQVASTQAAIALAEQMLETHMQRVEVLQAAVAAWDAARQRQEALLRHQEQLMQQDGWRSALEQHRTELRKAAAAHAEKARQLRASADKCTTGAAMLLPAGLEGAERSTHGGQASEVLSTVRAQAATIRAASEAADQHTRAEAEDTLAARAAALAHDVDREMGCLAAATEVVRPMYQRLHLAANASMSVARLQLICVGVCADQGSELTVMHDALASVRGLAGKIQGLLETAERHARAGHTMEAAAARGQATAVQDALQQELKAVRSCKQRLSGLASKLQDAKQELCLADKRMAQATRSAAATQSVTEYVHRAYELRYECGERQWSTLQLSRQAADAAERAELARRELKASQEAEKQLTQAGKADRAAVVGRTTAALHRSVTEAEAVRRLLDAQAVQETNACGSEIAAAGLYMDLSGLTVKLLQHMDELEAHQEEHEQVHATLEAARRSQHASNTLLQHRRGEMHNLSGQIEAHRLEGQLLRKMGNEAQALVRTDAANMIASQLAEIAEDVMKLEARSQSMEQKQALITSIYAKSEARTGLFSHLARLCSAAIGHLLDARDAHDNHSSHVREAAVAGVDLTGEEEALSSADVKVQELQESLAQLTGDMQAAAVRSANSSEDEDPDKLHRAIQLAQAELMLAHRRRAEAEQQVLATRRRVAQAELAAQSSQLRITKARQRAEDAQQLAESIRALLSGSSALTIDFAELQSFIGAVQNASSVVFADHTSPREARPGATGDANHQHGVLAAAQLHSVTLQALAEAAAKFIQTLDCAAAVEQRRGNVLSSAQAAEAVREAARRQQKAAEDLRATADGISMVRQVYQLTGRHIGRGDNDNGSNGGGRGVDSQGLGFGGHRLPFSASSYAASAGQDAAAAAGLELERLQHEAAYVEANVAQERKLVACLQQKQKFLRLAGERLLDMARFGVASELNAGPNMTLDEAASLLAACKHLSEQHASTLLLAPALDSCKDAEDFLKASVDCMKEAQELREKAIKDRLAALDDAGADALETRPALFAALGSSRNPRQTSVGGGVLPPAPAEEVEAKAAARFTEYHQLLADEERMLLQVQELDKAAAEFLEEGNSQVVAFAARWAELTQPLQAVHQQERAFPAADTDFYAQLESATPSKNRPWGTVEGRLLQLGAPSAEHMALLPSTEVPSSMYVQYHSGTHHSLSSDFEGPMGELSLSLMGAIAALGADNGHGNVGGAELAPGAPSSAAEAGIEQHGGVVLPLGGASGRKLRRAGAEIGDIDAELVAMAAATVARAKAAAAALAMKAFPARSLPPQQGVEPAPQPTPGPRKDGRKDESCTRTDALSPTNAEASRQANRWEPGNVRAAAAREAAATPGPNRAAAPGSDAKSARLTMQQGARPQSAVDAALDSLLIRAGAARQESPSRVLQRPATTPRETTADVQKARNVHRARSTHPPALASPNEAHTALPPLPRVPLPDDLDLPTASALQGLWSTATLHYQRAQHMHDCLLQQAERQWQRCQAQLQMLQAEELKARSLGRLSEADAVAAALLKWQQRGGHLDAAMRRHRLEFARHKALAYRATVMEERLQLTTSALAGRASSTITPAQADPALQNLLPRLPGSMLGGCGVMQSLERLHGELGHQVAALHAAVAGLQQQSQRLFAKASRRSNKLKVRLGATEGASADATAIAKSQSAAEQSAALGECAVEFAAHAQTLQELTERLSGDSAHCSQVLERLQRAAVQELHAQQALVQATDLHLCAVMQAVLRGERGAPMGLVKGPELRAQQEAPAGDFDSLLQGRHPPGACWSAACLHVRRGEDLAQDAARAVQAAKEQLELRIGSFARNMDKAAAALTAIASTRSAQSVSLRTQIDAAALCVARARSKVASQRAARDSAAEEKYSRAADGWSKQLEKLRREEVATSAGAEEMANRGQALANLGARLRPIQEALDAYLDEQLEAWASAALSRIHPRGLAG